jgi:hypothetical protein
MSVGTTQGLRTISAELENGGLLYFVFSSCFNWWNCTTLDVKFSYVDLSTWGSCKGKVLPVRDMSSSHKLVLRREGEALINLNIYTKWGCR